MSTKKDISPLWKLSLKSFENGWKIVTQWQQMLLKLQQKLLK